MRQKSFSKNIVGVKTLKRGRAKMEEKGIRLVLHYSEIGTKGKNRREFERSLRRNIQAALGNAVSMPRLEYGRIVCEMRSREQWEEAKESLSLMPGIARAGIGKACMLDIADIKREALEAFNEKKGKTFRVATKRSNKEFPLSSIEVNKEVGRFIADSTGSKVELKNPETTISIEIGSSEAYVFFEEVKGIGGLPVGSSGKVVSLLSGGIDSPVASFLAMKRGCRVVFVHAFNSTQAGEGALGKVRDIVKQLTRIQLSSTLYIVPFRELQQEIVMNAPSKLRMILYRRMMMRIAEEIAKKENAKAIITGDSIGQVASQTLENIGCIYHGSRLPVLPPLIGMTKEEIVSIAKRIGTYPHSIRPYPDCCSFMIAKHPETKGKLDEILKYEKAISHEEVRKCADKARVERYNYPQIEKDKENGH